MLKLETSNDLIRFQTAGNLIKIEGRTLNELIDEYEGLIVEVFKAKYNGLVEFETIIGFCNKTLEWIRSTDFYRAPASTRYHESVIGGLLIHTLNVYNNIIELKNLPQFKDVDIYSAILVALVHDWCKIGYYESYERNVKNEHTGQWEKEMAFRVNQTGIPLGHGVSSMFLASKFFKLTPAEALAIRWHMSRFRVCEDEINEFQLANENYPLVHMIQFADQLSITNYANKLF